jgi:tRNA G10  N-methylase Trm11
VKTYFFESGVHPRLSLAEWFMCSGKSWRPVEIGEGGIVAETDNAVDARSLTDRLGGCVKIVRLVEFAGGNGSEAAGKIAAYLSSVAPEGKISFGISLYNLSATSLHPWRRQIEKIGLTVKRLLKNEGRSVRFVASKEDALSAVIVTQNKLIETGGDFCLIARPDGIWIGITEAVQDFKAWSKRDFGRPAPDATSGMLPPKLARLMLNLGLPHPNDTVVLDPFCGSGTVLAEAHMLGCKTVYGGDTSEKAVMDSKTNIAWLGNVFPVRDPLSRTPLAVKRAEDAASWVPELVDAIVTEPYLGPPQTGRETEGVLKKIARELEELYGRSFPPLVTKLKPGGRIVVACPVFQGSDKSTTLIPLSGILKRAGLRHVQLVPSTAPATLQPDGPHGGLLYKRPDQHVAREILVYEKPTR